MSDVEMGWGDLLERLESHGPHLVALTSCQICGDHRVLMRQMDIGDMEQQLPSNDRFNGAQCVGCRRHTLMTIPGREVDYGG